MDILMGRGKLCYNSPGARHLREAVTRFIPSYIRSDHGGCCWELPPSSNSKARIVQQVIDEVLREGYRFVKKDGEIWVDLVANERRAKVFRLFRDLIRIGGGGGDSDGGVQAPTNKSTGIIPDNYVEADGIHNKENNVTKGSMITPCTNHHSPIQMEVTTPTFATVDKNNQRCVPSKLDTFVPFLDLDEAIIFHDCGCNREQLEDRLLGPLRFHNI